MAPSRKKDSPPAPKPAATHKPSRADIARRAYEIWRQRGGGHGNHEKDWHRAERELTRKS